MQLADLDYEFPEELVATQPKEPCRILFGNEAREISWGDFYNFFNPGDLIVINDTKVEKRRVFSTDDLEFLFLNALGNNQWEVLFPSRNVKPNQLIQLPGGVEAQLLQKGLPQIVQLNKEIKDAYFEEYGELALPPYIQKARGQRHNLNLDDKWYQTDWAVKAGSAASPTASLHFNNKNLENLKLKNVQIEHLTLHVGMGTFLPIKSENLNEHKMHQEFHEIPTQLLEALEKCKSQGHRVWALGTTVARALESYGATGERMGLTDLFIRPGFEWKVVDGLITNFHQPKSTLLLLVMAFAGSASLVKAAYQSAIKNKFRLFSYGDLTVWIK